MNCDKEVKSMSLAYMVMMLRQASLKKRLGITVYFQDCVLFSTHSATIEGNLINCKGAYFDLSFTKWILLTEDESALYVVLLLEEDYIDYARLTYPSRDYFHVTFAD